MQTRTPNESIIRIIERLPDCREFIALGLAYTLFKDQWSPEETREWVLWWRALPEDVRQEVVRRTRESLGIVTKH